MLGWVAPVNATESPSQLRPALIHRTWIRVSSAFLAASLSMLAAFRDLGSIPAAQESPFGALASPLFSVYAQQIVLSTEECDISHCGQPLTVWSIHWYQDTSPSPVVADTG